MAQAMTAFAVRSLPDAPAEALNRTVNYAGPLIFRQ
jgi:hypothetical protein